MLLGAGQETSKTKDETTHTQQSGFTLVEISIAIIIVGLLITPLFKLYETYLTEKQVRETRETIELIVTEMETYRNIQGAYPCPAPMNEARNSASNGRAMNSNDCSAAYFTGLPQVPGECSGGICLKSSTRAATSDIILGTVPFRELQMNEESVLDGYGNRLLYAVTQDLTNITSFNSEAGGIRIVDTASNKLTPDDNAMFLLLSFGPSEEGAYSKNGILKRACVSTSAEENNCIDDYASSTVAVDAIFTYAPVTSATGATNFDHQIQFHSTNQQRLWRRYTGDEEHAQDLSPDDQIGIGTDNPTAELDIRTEEVSGQNVASVLINSGELISENICDETGTYCFEPELLAGDVDAMAPAANQGGIECPNPGEYMVGIVDGQAVCEPHKIECDISTPIFNGFNSDGSLNCSAVPGTSCPPLTTVVCNPSESGTPDRFDITGLTVDGDSTGLIPFGSCARDGYRCDDGNWVRLSGHQVSASRCDFTPTVTVEEDLDCGPDSRFGDQTFDRTTTTVCGGGTNVTSTDCICGENEDGSLLNTRYEYRRCDQHYSRSSVISSPTLFYDDDGNPHETRREVRWTGTLAGGAGSCTNTVVDGWDTSNCECVIPSTGLVLGDTPWATSASRRADTRPAQWVDNGHNCPSGQSGDRLQLQYFDIRINQCQWRNLGYYDNSGCSCNGTDGDTQEVDVSGLNNGCGAGNWLPGSNKKQPQIYNGSTCQWENNGPVIDNCSCDTSPVTGSADHVCSDPVCQKPDPLNKDQTLTNINPTTCQLDTSTTVITAPGKCEPRTYIWEQIGSIPGNASSLPNKPPYVKKGCSCAEQKGQTTTCYIEGDNTFKRYKCQCILAE